MGWWCSWTCFMNNYKFMHFHEHTINFQHNFFCIKCLSTWFNILYILSKHGKRKGFIFMISLSKCTLIKQVVVRKPHCITQYFVQKGRHALQMNIQQCTHIAICKSIGKMMTQMEYMCCCGIALLVKLLNYNFFASWIIYKKRKHSSSTKHNKKCIWVL